MLELLAAVLEVLAAVLELLAAVLEVLAAAPPWPLEVLAAAPPWPLEVLAAAPPWLLDDTVALVDDAVDVSVVSSLPQPMSAIAARLEERSKFVGFIGI